MEMKYIKVMGKACAVRFPVIGIWKTVVMTSGKCCGGYRNIPRVSIQDDTATSGQLGTETV